ncbi:hypothetical protein Pst134EA_026821 [Puccinia striiformis f. sp. tritici]|uniref:hypothetical protein n=1 Tax=Puccinia striiformis f. sp. tritici TaxID=168172 RepID=UPI0020084685|nr:hypothetical protein Pst134EA_026821 [Puccinia striiformis f. sp. tritici]KAH9450111.1 hypothetical protein Pst134EA_026821 [Puccinia striiformis f. sp. tritici]KAI9616575.1 hypothetical protein H4Q26_010973 [Puccinia striiformis f. sp. tritici PST-130]
MARGNSKKRRRVSPTSSVSSTPAPTKNRLHPHKKNPPEIVELENSEEESLLTNQDDPIRSPKGLVLTDEQELKKRVQTKTTYINAIFKPHTISSKSSVKGTSIFDTCSYIFKDTIRYSGIFDGTPTRFYQSLRQT